MKVSRNSMGEIKVNVSNSERRIIASTIRILLDDAPLDDPDLRSRTGTDRRGLLDMFEVITRQYDDKTSLRHLRPEPEPSTLLESELRRPYSVEVVLDQLRETRPELHDSWNREWTLRANAYRIRSNANSIKRVASVWLIDHVTVLEVSSLHERCLSLAIRLAVAADLADEVAREELRELIGTDNVFLLGPSWFNIRSFLRRRARPLEASS